MNILILNWRDPKHPLAGGAEISLFEHAKYWKKKRGKVIWFSSSFAGATDEEEILGIKIVRRGSHYTVHLWAIIFYLTGKLGKPDVIIDCFHFLPFFTPLYAGKVKIIALIHEVAGEVWYKNLIYPLAFIGYHLEPLFFLPYKNKQFITVSRSTEKELIKLGVTSKNISVIHNGVDVEKVDQGVKREKIPTIIFLNRISKDKGIEDAIKAFIDIRPKIKDVRMWIAGKEEKEGHLKNLPKSVIYFGFVSEKKKFELLKRAWILIHPSQKEGWGLTVIEAASQGTPTIGYNVAGLRDSIVDGKTGLLVDPNPEALAKAIVKLINDEKTYQRLSKNAILWSKQFNWEKSEKESWKVIGKSLKSS